MPYDLNNPQLDFDLENQIQKAAFLRSQKMEDQKTEQYTGRKFSTPYQPMTQIGDALTNMSGQHRREAAENHMRTLGTEEERRLMALNNELNQKQEIDYTNQQDLIRESARRADIASRMSMLPKGRKAAQALLKDANAFPLTMGKTGHQEANLTEMQEKRQDFKGNQRELTAQSNSDLSLQEHLQRMEENALKPVKTATGGAKAKQAEDDFNTMVTRIQRTREMVKDNPNAVGWKTLMHDTVLQRLYPDGVATRASLGSLSAEKIHELSGAAVSTKEFERLRTFLPSGGDSHKTVTDKLENMYKELMAIKRDRPENVLSADDEGGDDELVAIPPIVGDEVDNANMQAEMKPPSSEPTMMPRVASLPKSTLGGAEPTVVRTGRNAAGETVHKMSDGSIKIVQN